MGLLTTFTIYNDYCYKIEDHPKQFARRIHDACIGHEDKSNMFYYNVIAQKTRHADDNTIYIHAGNTVVEFNKYSKSTLDLMYNNPLFFQELIDIMETNLKQLKKDFKQLNNK